MTGPANGVRIPASGVTFIVIVLRLSQEAEIQPLVAGQQCEGRAVDDVSKAQRFVATYNSRHFAIAGGIIAQRVRHPRSRDPGLVGIMVDDDGLGRSPAGTEKNGIGGSDRDFRPGFPNGLGFDKREYLKAPSRLLFTSHQGGFTIVSGWVVPVPTTAGKKSMGAVVLLKGQSDLLQMVDAFRAAGRLARRLNGGEQEPNENAYDGNRDEQLH